MSVAKLKHLRAKNFTVFSDLSLPIAPSLNVIVGENGSGKSHLLKLLYSSLAVSYQQGRGAVETVPRKGLLQQELADKLVSVFRPESLGRLARRKPGRERADVSIQFTDRALNMEFSFASNSSTDVKLQTAPHAWLDQVPAFIPTRELLTIYPGFVSLYEQRSLEFEETWRDTCILLGLPLTRGPKEARVRKLLEPIERSLGGSVIEEHGRFYLRVDGGGKFEMPLVAEGLRKLAMLARLIATGSLIESGYLFWDEPEANLNPKTIRGVAEAVLQLAASGVQVFLGTHSLFLIKELQILLASPDRAEVRQRTQFIGLHLGPDGATAQAAEDPSGIGEIASLDESLMQSDRYLEVV